MDAIAEIFNQHSQKVATLATIVLVVLISLSVADTALFVIENLDDEAIEPQPVEARKPVRSNADTRVDLAALNLFGKAEEAAAPKVIDAPETNLNLELQGVFTADDADDSTAIVAERGKAGELYNIGDRLPGNAILNAVFDDHILIKRGARIEKLMFSDAPLRQQFRRQSSNISVDPAPAASGRLAQVRERIAARRREIADRTAVGSTASTPGANLRAYVDNYRERIAEEPRAVLNELGVSPVADGEAQGYRIGDEVSQQALNQAGLQAGDVILSVNGTPVGNITNDQAIVDQALAAGRVRVEVQRNDRKFYLTVPLP